MPFHPAVDRWFSETFGQPTAAQQKGWEAIRRGRHTLIAAPTGSGKTLAAFLIAIDDLFREGLEHPLPDEVRVVYVSPLKALSADIHKNLAEPRSGIRQAAKAIGLDAPRITAAVRTGDTPHAERAAMLRTPPHILVTTPESLYLLLTAERSRAMLRTVRTVIVDEIHAVIGTRRGAHLALSLERLERVADGPVLRLGLSATQRPIETVARFLVGHRIDEARSTECAIVDEGHRRAMDLAIELPGSPLEAVMSHEVWEEYYERLAALIRTHTTTLVFVNTRKLAERVARHLSERLGEDAVTAHHGSLSKERRLDAEDRLKTGRLKALVATASLELGIDIGHVDLVCQMGSPHWIATFLQRVGRSGHSIAGTPKGRLFPISRDDLVECAALFRTVGAGGLDRIVPYDRPLDVLAQQIVAETSCADYDADDLFRLIRAADPFRDLERADFDRVVEMLATGFATRRGRRAALVHFDEVNGRVRGRRHARLTAITSGGAIPENADYRVVLDPEDVFIGTLNEDFAIESNAGDIFQLGNTSWRIMQVSSGTVRVQDAHGQPPTIPFWLGEAPGRSAELSEAVSALRHDIDGRLAVMEGDAGAVGVAEWLAADAGIDSSAAAQIGAYLGEARRMLGVLPTQDTLILERFFDESGGMQLVLHAPFGSRMNRAWGLALRKRFCRQFNFELQAAATEEALLLSLGPQHSFPLADVFRYLHPTSVRDVLVQALLDAPVFPTRWRWNTTIALAVPRNRNGKKVPPPLQRMLADDLMAAAFPDAAACLENIPGDRQIPDHPLVTQTIRDCLEEAMDLPRLTRILERIHSGEIQCLARDLPEPSPLSAEILSARPYAFLDDAPLEERRTQAVYARRTTEPGSAGDLGALDPDAIARVRDEARPDPRDADELQDALVTAGFLLEQECAAWATWFDELRTTRRATRVRIETAKGDAAGFLALWVAAERLPEVSALYDAPPGRVTLEPPLDPPRSRTQKNWSGDEAAIELLRGRLTIAGPVTAEAIADTIGLDQRVVMNALMALESEGVILRGSFTPSKDASRIDRPATPLEWCDRRLLARIHRYTLNRLRAEIEPVAPAEFMRYLFAWQHLHPTSRLSGIEGLRMILSQLDGFEVGAGAWEREVLPIRIDRYEPAMLDLLCLTGEVGWARLSARSSSDDARNSKPIASTPVALFLREHGDAWRTLGGASDLEPTDPNTMRVLDLLKQRGASFANEIAVAADLDESATRETLTDLVANGFASSDGFAGLRAIVATGARSSRSAASDRSATARPKAGSSGLQGAGRWHALAGGNAADNPGAREAAVELQARALLHRYGIVFRRVLAREPNPAPWRELTAVFRRLEARGEIRGGRFVSGMSGEQFALPEAITSLRESRRAGSDGGVIAISATDPLNLAGIVTAGDKIAAVASNRIAYRDGVPLAVLEGDYLRPLAEYPADLAGTVAQALTGRRVPPVIRGFLGRTG